MSRIFWVLFVLFFGLGLLGCGSAPSTMPPAVVRPPRVTTFEDNKICVVTPVKVEIIAGRFLCQGPIQITLMADQRPEVRYTAPEPSPSSINAPCDIPEATVITNAGSALCSRTGSMIELVQIWPGGYNVLFRDGEGVSHTTVDPAYINPLLAFPYQEEKPTQHPVDISSPPTPE